MQWFGCPASTWWLHAIRMCIFFSEYFLFWEYFLYLWKYFPLSENISIPVKVFECESKVDLAAASTWWLNTIKVWLHFLNSIHFNSMLPHASNSTTFDQLKLIMPRNGEREINPIWFWISYLLSVLHSLPYLELNPVKRLKKHLPKCI